MHTDPLLLKITFLTLHPHNITMSRLDRIAPERIRHRRRELPRTDALLEQDIQLGVGLALGLGQTEVRPDKTEGAHAGPEEAGLGAPVPGGGVDHARGDDVVEDADDVVQVAGQDDGLAAEAGGGDFGHEAVADGADGDVVGESVDDEHGSDDPGRGGVGLGGDADEADDQEEDVEADESDEVQRAATEAGHQKPGQHGAHGSESVLTHGEVESVGRVEAGLFVELDGVAHQSRAAERLDHPDHTGDLSAAEVGFLKAVEIAGADCGFLFEFVGMNHHSHGLGGVEFAVASAREATEGAFGFLEAAVADEPPGGFGGEENADEERDGPHPLQGEGDAVAPFGGVVEHTSEDAGANELAEDPAEINVGGEVRAESDRGDFSGVGGCDGLEDAPRETTEDLADEQHLDIDGEEGDEDEAYLRI